MKMIRTTAFAAASLLTAAAWAQSANPPLNLKLPDNVPAVSSSSTTPAATDTSAKPAAVAPQGATAQANANGDAHAKDPPGTYYGDTSGARHNSQASAGQPTIVCDDATYNQPQVHGSVTTGVVAGNHVSGSYAGGGVTLSQAFGSCEHPSGGMSISVGGSQGHYGH